MRSAEDQKRLLAGVVLQVRGGKAVSRRELADALGLSPSTAGQYVDHLQAVGMLLEDGLVRGGMGRPRRSLRVCGTAGWFAGVEFNADRLCGVRVDFAGQREAVAVEHLARGATAAEVVEILALMVRQLQADHEAPLLGLGVGVPGVVDPDAGIGVHYSFISGWDQIPLADLLNDRLQVPVLLENNLRAIAMAERWFGGGDELSDYVILGPRSGFGMAIVSDGRLVRGGHFAAGEPGRWPWPLNGSAAERQVQDALSAPAVYRRLAGLAKDASPPTDLHQALEDLGQIQGAAWESVIEDYGRVLGLFHLLVDAQRYFLHGPLVGLGARFCEELSAAAARIFPAIKSTDTLRVVPSELSDDAGALGAAIMAMEAWQPSL
ncbi:MAG: ROK family protein [Verrucomicrobiales bacterium]|nr:ROK family protein [Verrucomicrobiales bacterium]